MNSKEFDKDKVEHLFEITIECSEINTKDLVSTKMNVDFDNWNSQINSSDTIDLLALISLLDSRKPSTSREIKALRESVIAHVSYKNALQISGTMERLDKTATRLTIVSLALGLIGIVFTILQFVR